ncbi:tyrosyl-DNA phosphodiesterase-domain-containing protein [Truncatella angustata]|uniref:Tyrosyl-DNA phosphodiesterase-domain-containing protein n=1 Tax=Truncatella angustata TaxID=152316 RepID=A0A9P8RMV2_9PEZI|nr:tyrosyl-DNA phosphodiesterase-domain-containing protein [Truncatella angustata]KAH6646906.1 tyrosyl-DNA phosphodiesterase-domain-containing protein [Truncatella angustata]
MGDPERALLASRADRGALLIEEERQLQEAIRISRFDQEDVSTASEAGSETASEDESVVETSSTKRKAEEDLLSKRPKAARPSVSVGPPSSTMKFPDGAIRITRTPGRQHEKNCVNLKDVIDKRNLVSACIYAFFIANEEVFCHLPFSRSSNAVPIYVGRDPNMDQMVPIACEQAGITIKGKLTRKQLETVSASLDQLHKKQYGKNYHTFYAWSSGSSHSKILVLLYPEFLRLVITSCNLMDIDTVEGDNHWYIHDLPKRSSQIKGCPTHFEENLLAHLRALGSPEDFIDSIEGRYDYSKVKAHLVTSQPGTWSGAKAEEQGLLRLRRVIKDLDLDLAKKAESNKLQLEVCAASIGNLNTKWLNGFSDCALGKANLAVAAADSKVPRLKLFYPTVGDVKGAHESAQDGASNIGCHTRPWASAPNDIKNIFHHYESKDAGCLFHQKLIMAYNPQDSNSLPYFVYLGSANFSQSAWGALEPDKSKKANVETGGTKLVKMSNFECGVVIAGHLITGLLETGTKNWTDGIVPFHQDAARYNIRKDKPWNDPRWVEGYRDDWNGGS